MKWIASEGGPLLLLCKMGLQFWCGVFGLGSSDGEDIGGVKTDYDRACRIGGYTGVIAVGPNHGLVLGDDPMQTTWVPLDSGAGAILVRWMHADDEMAVVGHLARIPSELFEATSQVFHTTESPLILFDSALPGDSVSNDESMEIDLFPGAYEIQTGIYRPDRQTCLVLHRLVPFGDTTGEESC